MHPGDVHLTVSIVRYPFAGRASGGLCSRFLADRATEAGLFIQPSADFHLPEDDVPIIMIGAGTGIAPFRGFLQERQARSAKGQNWLIFGEQREASDFYYRGEIKTFLDNNYLYNLSTAFFHDQAQKIYVQDKLRENGARLWAWLCDGAYIYIYGDASRIAKDVHNTLPNIISQHGGMTRDEARLLG